jgi:D-beta-D-heptose 7-phosphate kinase/D-beta-D-heptose 1-phosphate adenosyltransferase
MGMSDQQHEIHDRLVDLQNKIKNLHGDVVLVGDIMLDRYIHGYANNLNSSAPVPVLKETRRYEDVGAAAHVARGLENIGLNAFLFGVVGNDRAGANIIKALEAEEVDCDGIEMVEGRITTVKNRLIAGREYLITNQQLLLRWDIEDDGPIAEKALDLIIEQAINKLDSADVLIISDYGHGVITDHGASKLIGAAKAANVPIICDPKLTGLNRITGADWVIFQTRGLDLMAKRMGIEDSYQAAKQLVADNQWGNLLVLEGEKGVTVHSSDGEVISLECTLEEPRGVTGIIDAAGVALAAALKLSLTNHQAAQLANAAVECIMGSDDNFTLTGADLADRLAEVAWNMQISQR